MACDLYTGKLSVFITSVITHFMETLRFSNRFSVDYFGGILLELLPNFLSEIKFNVFSPCNRNNMRKTTI